MDNDTDSQTDQPASPTGNVAATASPNDPDHSHAPSPDPPSTRPNPFDDSELSARKRRRTSGSASPPPSASVSASASASPGASTSGKISADDKSAVKRSSTSTMIMGQQSKNTGTPSAEKIELPCTPRTPTDSAKSSSPTPLSSSKVTINLRKVADPATDSAETFLPSLSNDEALPVISNVTGDGQQKMTVEESQRARSGEETAQMSDSASPPVELIAISDDENEESDDEMAFSVDEKATGILSRELVPLDPTPQFPYIQRNEEPSLPLLRFIHHFKAGMDIFNILFSLSFLCQTPIVIPVVGTKTFTDSPINPEALILLQAWIQDYLKFARNAEKSTVLDSRQANRRFWLMFPESMLQLLLRRYVSGHLLSQPLPPSGSSHFISFHLS